MTKDYDPSARRRRQPARPASPAPDGSATPSRRARLAAELLRTLEERKAEIDVRIAVLRGPPKPDGPYEH